jgi:dienelactone hydrolase
MTGQLLPRLARIAAGAVFGLAAIGCAGTTATPTAVPQPTASVAVTPAPTPTLAPTPTPQATAPAGGVLDLPTGLSADATYDQFAALLAYHSSVPFDIKENGSRKAAGGVTVKDITYMGEGGQPVSAYLIVPAGKGPFPAILFEHGMGDDRDQFIDGAISMAGKLHAVGLVPTRPVTAAINGTGEAILQMREMRHGLDLLAAQPGVDKSRLGYVGFSMGACIGSEIVAFEPRIKAAVLMAAVPDVCSSWLDAAVVAPHATTARLFFQFGEGDSFYEHADIDPFVALYTGQPKVKWYPVPHDVAPEYLADAQAWLATEL